MRYTEESVLAMVFDEPRFADQFGYVQDYIVAKHFFGDRWQAPSARLGFATGFSGYKPAPRRHPGIVVTNELLNAAWASFVENPPESWSFYHRYPTEFDKRFAEMDFDFPATREPFWKRWFGSRVSA